MSKILIAFSIKKILKKFSKPILLMRTSVFASRPSVALVIFFGLKSPTLERHISSFYLIRHEPMRKSTTSLVMWERHLSSFLFLPYKAWANEKKERCFSNVGLFKPKKITSVTLGLEAKIAPTPLMHVINVLYTLNLINLWNSIHHTMSLERSFFFFFFSIFFSPSLYFWTHTQSSFNTPRNGVVIYKIIVLQWKVGLMSSN